MVCAAHPAAAQAGLDMLHLGGNAIDAALAISFTLGVVEPYASGLGGGGFMTIWMPDTGADSSTARLGNGRVLCLDFRESAPAAATPDHYYGTGQTVHALTLHGPLAVAVPGMPSGLAHAAAHFGLLSRQTLEPMIEPAIRHAEHGIPVTPKMAKHFAAYHGFLSRYPTTARIFTRPQGPIPAGELLRQPELAQTLAHISEVGLEAFNQDMLAPRLERFMAAHGGLVAANDLAAYRTRERPIIRGTYRGYTLLTAPPPSTGGMRLLQVLNVLERYPVGDWGPHAAATIHVIAEVLKASFAAGERYIADPATLAAIPIDELIDKAWAADLSRNLSRDEANPAFSRDSSPDDGQGCTTHYSIIDRWGNIVSATQTIGLFWGSGMVLDGTGLLLNGEMNDFSEGRAHLNAVAPGKIPRSHMCPTVVLKDDRPFLILGSPASHRIPSAVLQTLSNVIDHNMDLAAAVAAARAHWQDGVLHLEAGIEPQVAAQLEQKGHAIERYDAKDRYFGGVHAIRIDPQSGALSGAADPRRDGQALGY
jgi:gamma-glutamyltranspeptidase/glutathione hydrolase